MQRKIIGIVTFVAAFVTVPAFAQSSLPEAGEAMGRMDGSSEVAAVTEHDFEGDDVTGEMVKPFGERLDVVQHRRTSSLVTTRANFVVETMRTVEQI